MHTELRGKVGPIRQHRSAMKELLRLHREILQRHMFELGQVSVMHQVLIEDIFAMWSDVIESVDTLTNDLETLLAVFDSLPDPADTLRKAKQLERQAEYKAQRAREMQDAARSTRYDIQRCIRTVEHVSASAIDNRLLFGTWVYLIKAGNGDLLYVGQTRNLVSRLADHRRKDWFPDDGSVDLLPCENVEHALRVERDLIKELTPVHNLMHNTEGNN